MLDVLLGGQAAWFGVPALVGTLIFALKLALLLMGGSGDSAEMTETGDGHADNPLAFKLLSTQSLVAFGMGFGWAGLAGLKALGWGFLPSFGLALGGGFAMAWLVAMMFRGMAELQSSGNIKIDDAIGLEGDVYAQVPARGTGRGQVRLVVSGRQRIFNAESDGDAAPSRTRVRVVKVNDDNSVVVTRV